MAQSKPAPASKQDDWTWDPTYLASLRELWLILSYTICVSFYFGYPADKSTPIPLIWGVPQWFLIGVAAPWGAATIISVLFALFYMTDDATPRESASSDASSEIGA
jgi:hypothetical protein